MKLVVHRADRPRPLVDALCDQLAQPLADPFSPEVVSVPTNGIQRWLSEQISLTLAARSVSDGIAANIDWPYPSRLVTIVLDALPDASASAHAWRSRNVDRHVEAVLTAHVDEPWLALLARYMQPPSGSNGGIDDGQRLRAARRIRALFRAYAIRRPEMVASWAKGLDLGPDGEAIDPGASWQPNLFRLVRESIGAPALPEVLPGALERIEETRELLDLPGRVSVYGITAIDPVYLDVLEALARVRDVHLYLLHPSPALWDALSAARPAPGRLSLRADDETRDLAVHPIVESWGNTSRELQLALEGRAIEVEPIAMPPREPEGTLLGALQHGVRSNLPPEAGAGVRTGVEDGTDRSLQIHSCYGARRQVEAMRDAVLHLFADDDSLEPRDVVIMTPDLGTYAPLIEAAFAGRSGGGGLPDLRVEIADRSVARRNPLVRFVGTVLDLARSRLGAGTIRDLIAQPLVQRRFRLDADLVGEIDQIIDETNVAWGLDGSDRARAGTAERDEHTWRRGIDRVVAGIFHADSPIGLAGDVAPLHGIEGDRAQASRALVAIMSRVGAVVEILRERRPSSEWPVALATSVGLLATSEAGAFDQEPELEQLLERLFAPEEGDADPVLGLDEVQVLTEQWTEDRPSRLHHRTGNVTVCTLVPMRSVPYRVVCLLGLDGERFPRSSRADGDDLLVDHEVVGDYDRGAEDRQLLLDALMAAEDHLIVTYSGRDELTNVIYPPSVPVAELRDAVADTVGEEAAARVVTEHPLQSFSDRNFEPGALGVEGPWSFDPMYFEGALAMQREPAAAASTPQVTVEPPDEGRHLALADLADYFSHPSRYFSSRSMRLAIPKLGDRDDDELPIETSALDEWAVANRLLEGLIRGYDVDLLLAHERGRDSLPAGRLGEAPIAAARPRASAIFERAIELGFRPDDQEQVVGVVEGPFGELVGSVSADPSGQLVPRISPSRLRGKQRLALYLELVFLSAIQPDIAWRGLLVGRPLRGDGLESLMMGPIFDQPDERRAHAVERIGELAEIWSEGRSRPLPIFPETTYSFASARPARRREEARQAWETSPFGYPKEDADRYHRMCFPHVVTIDDVITPEFVGLAERIWWPIAPLLWRPE